jgi:hypothetical protein
MANHVRRQLRDAVTTAVTNLATTGARVFGRRVYALDQVNELPCLEVYSTEEEAGLVTVHAPATVERVVEIHVVGHAAANTDLDDTLDLIAKEVETALANGVVISSKTVALIYRGAAIEFEAGERPIGSIDLRFNASLYNTATAPDILT